MSTFRRVLLTGCLIAIGLTVSGSAASAPVPRTDVYSSGNLALDIGSGAASALNVPDSGTIRRLKVSVRLRAVDVGLLDLTLVAPDGTAHEIVHAGDATGTDLGSGAGDCRGRLATFDVKVGKATDSAGTWKLRLDSDGTAGKLFCWQLSVSHLAEVARQGTLSAVLTYRHDTQAADGVLYKNLRLRILSAGRTIYTEAVRKLQQPQLVWRNGDSVQLADLDGDGHPEVLLWLYSGGAHCCSSTNVYRIAGSTVTRSSHDFGNPGARLERSGGRRLFVTADDRFAYLFTSFAYSGFPVRIVRWQGDRFADVTRTRPDLVRKDSASWWRATARELHSKQEFHDPRGVLAAWAADECLLGHRAAVDAKLKELLRAGALSHLEGWSDGPQYVAALWRSLKKFGYVS